MRFAYHRLDANHRDIRAGLEALGATCESKGPLDLIVGFRGANYLLEIKTNTGKLRPTQQKFFREWKGQKALVRTMDDALKAIGAVR